MKNNAFLIIAHNDPKQLSNLIESFPENSDVFIHLDIKSNIEEFKLENYSKRVHFIDERVNVSWGSISMVYAMINLLKTAVKQDVYKHLTFLSGNDYAIKNKNQMDEFFEKNDDVELIRAYSITKSPCPHCHIKVEKTFYMDPILKNKKLDHIYRKIAGQIVSKLKNKHLIVNNKELEIFYGSQWFSLTYNAASYILEYIDRYPEVIDFFKTSYAPDEMFFHTIFFNSPFANNSMKNGPEKYSPIWNLNNYHYLSSDGLNCPTEKQVEKWTIKEKTTAIFVKEENQGIVKVLDMDDVLNLKNSDYIFARKFNSDKSEKLIEYLKLNQLKENSNESR